MKGMALADYCWYSQTTEYTNYYAGTGFMKNDDGKPGMRKVCAGFGTNDSPKVARGVDHVAALYPQRGAACQVPPDS